MAIKETELKIPAKVDQLSSVQSFIDGVVEQTGVSMKDSMQISLAVEEIFVNIASYAYQGSDGEAVIKAAIVDDPASIKITFIDSGVPFDPLKKEDPDVTLGVHERDVGGLGIFLTKKTMDDVNYVNQDGKNILTITKNI
ncbi:MAG: ATP-binding protein [Saccharofermentans sp.]|nr:ATP-binding protein [Saccharofermentans sp.]